MLRNAGRLATDDLIQAFHRSTKFGYPVQHFAGQKVQGILSINSRCTTTFQGLQGTHTNAKLVSYDTFSLRIQMANLSPFAFTCSGPAVNHERSAAKCLTHTRAALCTSRSSFATRTCFLNRRSSTTLDSSSVRSLVNTR